MIAMMRRRVPVASLIATLMLVVATAGGAWAAGKYLITSTSQIKPSVLKKLQGRRGPAGPAGINGTNGANGKDGAPGVPGEDGEDGADGKSVISTEFGPTEEEELGFPCGERGGSQFEVEGSGQQTYACTGEEGSPWTAGGVLPPGKTETGTFIALPAGGATFGSISFPIPLVASLEGANVHVIEDGGTVPAACNNEVAPTPSPANPEADAGHLCLFGENPEKPGIYKPGSSFASAGAGTTGALLAIFAETFAFGSWAVTAKCPGAEPTC
jgi:collagen triple helix repeat protein